MSSSRLLFKLRVSGWSDFDAVKLQEIWLCRCMFSGPRQKSNTIVQAVFRPLRDAGSGLRRKLPSDWLGGVGSRICGRGEE